MLQINYEYLMEKIKNIIQASVDVKNKVLLDDKILQTVKECVYILVTAFKNGNKVLFCGNGGSAADAQHLAGEFVSRFHYDRHPLASVALTTDTSVMTAIGNDYGYEKVFERQVQGLGRPGDVLVGISTSGRSPNVLLALQAGKAMGLVTVGMTGNQREKIEGCVDLCIRIPSRSTPKIQEGHIVVGHALCGLVEAIMYPRPAAVG